MKKNFIYNIIYQILILILPLITVPYVSRIFGADGVGIYSYTYSITYYFMLISMLGLNNYGNRAIAKVRDDKEKTSKEFCSIYAFQILTSAIMIIAYLLYIFIFNNQYKMIAFIQIMYIISSMFDINWFFFGIEKFKLTITRNTLVKVLSLIFIFMFVKTQNDVWKYTAILAGSTLLSNIFLFSFIRKYVYLTKVTKKDIIKHLKPNLILFLPVIAVSIYKIMDKIMLGILSTVTEVGYYENAEKITQVPVAIITALGTVMMPRVTNMLSNQQESKVKNIIKKTMPFVMFMTFPMVIGLIAISNDFSAVFFGHGFEKSGLLIQLLSITIIFLAWGNVIRTQYLIPKEKDKEYVISAFIGAIVNFIINCIFIPIYGSIGACFGTIVAEFFVMIYQSWKIRYELPLLEYIKSSLQFVIKSIIMFIIIICVGKVVKDNLLKKIFIQIIVGIIVYGLLNLKYILENLPIKCLTAKNKRRHNKMKTYFITGGAGFIGSTLTKKLLEEGNKVVAIDNFCDFYNPKIKENNIKEFEKNENYKIYKADIRDRQAIKQIFDENKIDVVMHLAAMAGVRPSIENPLLYQEVNCLGTQNILEEMKIHNINNGVFASSSSVYGNCKEVPFNEDMVVDFAISPYAATKKANEVMTHVYHKLYNMNIIMLRFFTVYGPKQRPDLAINKFTRLMLEGKEIPMFGDGSTSRDYTYVDDIVDGIIKSCEYVLKNENVYEILNIGNSSPTSLKEMIMTIGEVLGIEPKIKQLPMQPGDVDRTYADISKAKKLLSYEPHTSFKEGIEKFVVWYKNNQELYKD